MGAATTAPEGDGATSLAPELRTTARGTAALGAAPRPARHHVAEPDSGAILPRSGTTAGASPLYVSARYVHCRAHTRNARAARPSSASSNGAHCRAERLRRAVHQRPSAPRRSLVASPTVVRSGFIHDLNVDLAVESLDLA